MDDGDFFYYENTANPFLNTAQFKSTIRVGNFTLSCTKHFNWFQKLMMRICFGFEVRDVRKEQY